MKKVMLSLLTLVSMSSFGYSESIMSSVEQQEAQKQREKKDEGLYVGISYTRPSLDVDHHGGRIASEMDFNGASLQLGYKVNPYISVEGRYGISFGDPDVRGFEPNGADVTVWGIYAKPTYPFGPEFDVYALLGYAGSDVSGTFDIDGTPTSFSIDEGSFSWGVGGRYILTETFSVYADYLVYYDDSTVLFDKVLDSINFGISYQF